jgi:pyruvate-formate lyase-activating enzyme
MNEQETIAAGKGTLDPLVGNSVPHPRNFCGCGFPDWLEVNLTPACNASCAWCVERRGWHPRNRASWMEIADAAIATGRMNIILLGGEPTLHPDIGKIIERVRAAGRKPWVTTNGSRLTASWVNANLRGVEGVNISVHHYDMARNGQITGLNLDETSLRESVALLGAMGTTVRMNCNCIRGQIDTADEMRRFVGWAKEIGASKVRFAELKHADGDFVDLAEVLGHKYGTNDNPFRDGCSSDAEIDGMPVNFRQMCGMQTRRRPCPESPEIVPHPVLYYDGKLYDGWQQRKDTDMTAKELVKVLEAVKDGKMTVAEAAILVDRDQRGEQERVRRTQPEGGGSCVY